MSAFAKFVPDDIVFHPTVDGEIDTTFFWRIRAPTFRDERRVSEGLKGGTSRADVIALEIAHTFAGTNFPDRNSPTDNPDEDAFVPLLRDDATPEQVIKALDDLPAAIVAQIWDRIPEVAPNWGPRF